MKGKYTELFTVSDLHEKLAEWEAFYNCHRPHSAHAGKTPYEVLKNKLGL